MLQALQEVIRGGSMTQKDKLRRLQEMCARPEGWLLQKCLEGNGWNPVRGCLEGFPCWSEAVHRLTVSLNALASERMPPPLVDESDMVYVAPTGPDCFAGTSCLDLSAVWLREILSPPATRSIVKLDLSASNHVKLGGATVSSILEVQALAACLPVRSPAPRLALSRVLESCACASPGLLSTVAKSDSESTCSASCVAQPLVTGMRVGELDLSGSPLQDVGAQAIAKLLSDPRCSLEKLNLSSCLFWTVGCMAILGAAHKCDSLQALGLANNDVGTPGALMVARLLRQGLRLLSLDLGNARVSGQGMQAIAEALPDNVSLLALNLRDNDAGFAEEPWRQVIQTHRYLQKLTLPRPVTTTMVSALEEAHSSRQKAVLPPVNWQLAMCMSMHPRLGARSLLRHLPCHLLECVVGLSCSAFELELSPPPTLEADGQDQAAA